jgi:hypothetical protein
MKEFNFIPLPKDLREQASLYLGIDIDDVVLTLDGEELVNETLYNSGFLDEQVILMQKREKPTNLRQIASEPLGSNLRERSH